MQNKQYTNNQGETYVLWENSNSNGHSSPVLIKVSKQQETGEGGQHSRSYISSSDCWVKLFGQRFYVPRWAQNFASAVRFQVIFFVFTVIASHIIFVELPVLLRPVLEP
jgi:hypothetical protein